MIDVKEAANNHEAEERSKVGQLKTAERATEYGNSIHGEYDSIAATLTYIMDMVKNRYLLLKFG